MIYGKSKFLLGNIFVSIAIRQWSIDMKSLQIFLKSYSAYSQFSRSACSVIFIPRQCSKYAFSRKFKNLFAYSFAMPITLFNKIILQGNILFMRSHRGIRNPLSCINAEKQGCQIWILPKRGFTDHRESVRQVWHQKSTIFSPLQSPYSCSPASASAVRSPPHP